MSATELGTGPGFCVYRLFNEVGHLLFLGCPQSRTRLQAHLCRGSWQSEIAGVHVREFATLNDALADEAAALVAEAPLHNLPAEVTE
jgi:hypothetical protein